MIRIDVDSTNVVFNNSNLTNSTLADTIFNSLASNNPSAAVGGQDGDTIEEIRQNSLGNFQNQLRTVTKEDYLIRALSMPSSLGTIAKAYAAPVKINEFQPGELPTMLDLFVLTYDANGNLRTASPLMKQNLQTYLAEYRMINDSVKIKDAFIINIEVIFDIIVLPNFNNNEILAKCITAIQDYFVTDKWQINQPIVIRNLTIILDKIDGVQTVANLQIINKAGTSSGYSEYAYSIPSATQGGVVYPSLDPSIFEVKYPNEDIKGRIVSLGTGAFGFGGF